VIPVDWLPTAENINALPEPLRSYIHDLEARADPAGEVRDLVLIRDENRALRTALSSAFKPGDFPEFTVALASSQAALDEIKAGERDIADLLGHVIGEPLDIEDAECEQYEWRQHVSNPVVILRRPVGEWEIVEEKVGES
jgi:hypothetical protein